MAHTGMNSIAHEEKDDRIMASHMYSLIGRKGRDYFAGQIWRDGEVWTSIKTLIKKMLGYVQALTAHLQALGTLSS